MDVKEYIEFVKDTDKAIKAKTSFDELADLYLNNEELIERVDQSFKGTRHNVLIWLMERATAMTKEKINRDNEETVTVNSLLESLNICGLRLSNGEVHSGNVAHAAPQFGWAILDKVEKLKKILLKNEK